MSLFRANVLLGRVVAVLALLCGVSLALAAPPAGQYVPGELLVKYREGAQIETLHAASKATPLGQMPLRRWQHLRLPPELSVEEAIALYRQQPEVEYAEPNYLAYKAETTPNDPEFNRQWALKNIKAELAWDDAGARGSKEVVVAVLDTGIFHLHPDLSGNMWVNPGETANGEDSDGNGIVDDIHGARFKGSTIDGQILDDDTADWHGTHVAGSVGAVGNNALGISGVNWQVSLMGVKVLHGPSGSGTTDDIVKGIDYAIANGAHVINMSLVIRGYSNALADALARADEAGVLTVSAAGNASSNNDSIPYSPAAIRTPNNIAVAAIRWVEEGQPDALAGYSNYGRLSVDIAAPGGECATEINGICTDNKAIYSTIGTSGSDYNQYRYLSGTSMAVPHVSGLAALLMARYPELTHHQIKARILNGVRALDALDEKTISGGTIDAATALSAQEQAAVFRIVPSQPYAGDELVITGVNFGEATGSVGVLNGTGEVLFPAPSSWSDNAIRVVVPDSLPLNQWQRLQVNGEGNGFWIQRRNRPPSVTLTVQTDGAYAPQWVTLEAEASDQDGEVVKYEWDLGDGKFQDGGTVSSFTHYVSSPGSYTLRVRVSDNNGATAIASAQLELEAAANGTSDSRCFIATAAYGSPWEAEVMTLRQFRDRFLMSSTAGRLLVNGYYAVSPSLADTIRQHSGLRKLTQSLLRPLVAVASWLVKEAEAGSNKPLNPPEPVPEREYLLGFIIGTDLKQVAALVLSEGGHLIEYNAKIGLALARWPASVEEEALLQRLEAYPSIRYAEPNRVAHKP
ncbi:MAG: S8 family serine peptidase [Thiohalomonadaceae bacterium]